MCLHKEAADRLDCSEHKAMSEILVEESIPVIGKFPTESRSVSDYQKSFLKFKRKTADVLFKSFKLKTLIKPPIRDLEIRSNSKSLRT